METRFSLRSNASQFLGILVTVLLGILAIGLLQAPQLEKLQTKSQAVPVEDIRRALKAEEVRLNLLQKLPSLGYENVIADWVFLNFLQYFGDVQAREKTNYRLSPDYFEVILSRNPYFLKAYTFLSISTSLYAGMPNRSVALMEKGLKSLTPTIPSESFYVWRTKATDELLFLGDAQAARRSFEKAAEWAIASGLPNSQNSAALSQQTAQFLATNPNSKNAQVGAWMMVLSNAPDDRTRRTAIYRIQALGGQILAGPNGTFQIKPPSQD